MKWPRGKYNGWRITGVEFKFVLDVEQWLWRPKFLPIVGGVHWLCFRTWTEWHYARD